MKTFISKSKIAALAFLMIFSVASTESFAGNSSENTIELKYLGKVDNQPVFELTLHNKEEDKFMVRLFDKSGAILYAGELEGKDISRKFRISIEEIGAANLTFEVKSKKGNTKTVYTVSTTSHVVEDVAISKL